MSLAAALPKPSQITSLHCHPLAAIAILCVVLSPTASWAQESSPRLPAPQQRGVPTRLGGGSIYGGQERLPSRTEDGRLQLPPIATATTSMHRIGTGSIPVPSYNDTQQLPEQLVETVQQRDAQWAWSVYPFAASNTFSNPLYFEDVMLERHGHERFPKLQPLISGARFFATVPMLPYLMTIRPPAACEYKMGHFRPGDCVYPYLQRPPYVRNALIVETAAVAGAAVALP